MGESEKKKPTRSRGTKSNHLSGNNSRILGYFITDIQTHEAVKNWQGAEDHMLSEKKILQVLLINSQLGSVMDFCLHGAAVLRAVLE